MKKLLLTSITALALTSNALLFAANPQSASIAAHPHAQKMQATAAQNQPKLEKHTKASDDAAFDAIESHQSMKQEQSNEDVFDLIAATEKKDASVKVNDPFSGINRVMFKMNDNLDKYIARPVAEAYEHAIPKPINHSVNRFFDNLENIPIVTNDVLQGKLYQASSDFWRLLINSTIGIGGLFDVAKHVGLQQSYEDFGLTLATWGWKNSMYFVLPILGPSTFRDGLGRGINFFALSAYTFIDDPYTRWGLYLFGLLNTRVQLLSVQGVFDSAAIDPYIFSRDAYIQRRNYLIEENAKKVNPYTARQTFELNGPFYLYH